MKLSIIIPAFNEEKTVGIVLDSIIKLKLPGIDKEIIVVDDGSSDKTSEIIEKVKKRNPELIFLNHKKNQGKGAAVVTGIKNARGDYIVIQDADSEYDPKYIANLLVPIQKKEAEIVYGTRLNRLPNLKGEEAKPLFVLHYLGNRFLSFITSILYGRWVTDMETCYKLFPRSAFENIRLRAKGFELEPEITAKLLKLGLSFKEVSITAIPRGYNEGKKLSALHDGPRALWALIKYRFVD
ncbi:MAG: glycosyl transferase [Candidatus Levybacteria bacterium CG_4_10_14_0_2_um_filter_36_16]|nr:MAG: glycosyl transferase [Candidatus Levybacteria bacterium CG2_30_37_29]PIZ96568.1 MAG: glycosyl transferase [Candidatus Levybacteria bacterium CG_4_10_14_0_2_um_filter_36_16]PJA90331.1 MAG: glycosyl transferase [Candidatus Levybacteria bacterium CG_4_9_14_3_um_filter_36_7]